MATRAQRMFCPKIVLLQLAIMHKEHASLWRRVNGWHRFLAALGALVI
jgi:hypothetical protein